MDAEALRPWLDRFPPFYEERIAWGDGDVPLLCRAGVTSVTPPMEFVSSVRGVCLNSEGVLVHRDPSGYSVLPGGGVERNETAEETLVREVAEETGWLVRPICVIGYMSFRHLGPWREAFRKYESFPEFMQPVYVAELLHLHQHPLEPDEYVWWSGLAKADDAMRLATWEPDWRFLEEALAKRVG